MNDQDRHELKERIRAILKHHAGPARCITMTALHAEATGEIIVPRRRYDQTRITRSIVEQLRREGCPIGNKGGRDGGYFWARNDGELTQTIAVFHGRAMSSLGQEAALKRVNCGELLRQYEIELNDHPPENKP